MPVVQGTIQTLAGGAVQDVPVAVELVGGGGGPVEGYVTATKAELSGVLQLLTNASGVYSATLTANTLITPAGTAYKITEQVPGDVDVKFVTVPTAAGPHNVADILTNPPGAVEDSALAAHKALPAGTAHSGGSTGTGNPATTVAAETAYGVATAVGTSLNFAREDHTHGSPAGGVATTVTAMNAFDLASVVGTATTFSREDHRHSTPATPGALSLSGTVAAETAYGIAANAGAASTASKGDHTHGSPTKPVLDKPFFRGGTMVTGLGVSRWYANRAITIVSVRASVNTAPTGQSAIFDVKKNGTTIFGTSGNRPTIAVSTFTALSGAFSTSTLAQGDYLTVDIAQIGSTIAGADATVNVEYTVDG